MKLTERRIQEANVRKHILAEQKNVHAEEKHILEKYSVRSDFAESVKNDEKEQFNGQNT